MQIHSTRAQCMQAGTTGSTDCNGSAAASAAGAFDAMLGAAVEAMDGSATLNETVSLDAIQCANPAQTTIDADAASAVVSRDDLPADDTDQIAQVVDAMLSLLQPAAAPTAIPAATTTAATDDSAKIVDAQQPGMRVAATGIGSTGLVEADSERAATDEAAEAANVAEAAESTHADGIGFRVSAIADGDSGPGAVASMHGLTAAHASAPGHVPANTASAPPVYVPAPFGSSSWPQAFGEQVLWSARQSLQSASLTLNPPELGPVQIELTLTDEYAHAHFSSPLPEVRQAIEQALPQLKDLFSDAGLDLQQASVDSSPQQQQDRRDQLAAGAEHAVLLLVRHWTMTTPMPCHMRALWRRTACLTCMRDVAGLGLGLPVTDMCLTAITAITAFAASAVFTAFISHNRSHGLCT